MQETLSAHLFAYMADHAGGRRSVVNPGTKERFWRRFRFRKIKQK